MKAIAIVALVAGAAYADDKAASREHYESGRKAYADAHFDRAISEFQAAYAAFPAPEYLHDIAQAYRRLERPCDAVSYFERYLAAKPDADNKADVAHQIDELGPQCAPAIPAVPAPPQTTVVVAERHPSPYSATATAGVALLGAGPVAMPPVGWIDVGARRRLPTQLDVHVGAGVSLARLPYDDTSHGTVWLTTPELRADIAYEVYPRVAVVADAGLGATIVSGLDMGNPFSTGGASMGAFVTPRLRADTGIAWRASERLVVRVLPLGYVWSPARKLASDIGALRGFEMSAGVEVGW